MKESAPFSRLSRHAAPAGLRESVRARVALVERRATYLRSAGFITLALASFASLALSCEYAWSSIISSGFGQYVSLLFTDSSAVLSSGRELGFSLVESLPALGIALALAALAASVWSVARLIALSRGPKASSAFLFA